MVEKMQLTGTPKVMNKAATFIDNNPYKSILIATGVCAALAGSFYAIGRLLSPSPQQATEKDQAAFLQLGDLFKSLVNQTADVVCARVELFMQSPTWHSMSSFGTDMATHMVQSVYNARNAPCNATNTNFTTAPNESTYFSRDSMNR